MTISVLEARYYIQTGKTIKLSHQELLDRTRLDEEVGSTYATDLMEAFSVAMVEGVSLKENYAPWVGSRQDIRPRVPGKLVLILKGCRTLTNEEELLNFLSLSPVAAVLTMDSAEYNRIYINPQEEYHLKKVRAPEGKEPVPLNIRNGYHGIVIYGCGLTYLLARDSNGHLAPNNGKYKIRKESRLGEDDEKSIIDAIFPELVELVKDPSIPIEDIGSTSAIVSNTGPINVDGELHDYFRREIGNSGKHYFRSDGQDHFSMCS